MSEASCPSARKRAAGLRQGSHAMTSDRQDEMTSSDSGCSSPPAQPRCEAIETLFPHLALPYRQRLPSSCGQLGNVPQIPLNILPEFPLPERRASRRRSRLDTSGVPMPKAAMNEDHGVKSGKHDVRTTRKLGRVQPESKTPPVQITADGPFRTRILSADASHERAALGFRQCVAHSIGSNCSARITSRRCMTRRTSLRGFRTGLRIQSSTQRSHRAAAFGLTCR
jgi:hypothetical protein